MVGALLLCGKAASRNEEAQSPVEKMKRFRRISENMQNTTHPGRLVHKGYGSQKDGFYDDRCIKSG
jgi:hypothetical protein